MKQNTMQLLAALIGGAGGMATLTGDVWGLLLVALGIGLGAAGEFLKRQGEARMQQPADGREDW